jgi:hypothetical protein
MNFETAILGRTPSAIRALLVLCIMLFAGGAGPVLAASADQAPQVDSSQARVWFLRQLNPGGAMHAPMIFANGAPIAISSEGTAFYRDFAPGNYAFTVENCNGPGRPMTLPLGPGNQFALQVRSDDMSMTECAVNYYLSVPSADMLSMLFAPLAYLGQR